MAASSGSTTAPTATVVVYSQDAALRASIRLAVGRRPVAGGARIEWVECDRFADVITQIDVDGADLLILDGEAQPTGGMGLSRQLKSERDAAPPIIVLLARAQDGWLASWARADGVIARPVDPLIARRVVAAHLAATTAVPHVR